MAQAMSGDPLKKQKDSLNFKNSSIILSSRKENSAEQKNKPTLNRWKFLAGIDENK